MTLHHLHDHLLHHGQIQGINNLVCLAPAGDDTQMCIRDRPVAGPRPQLCPRPCTRGRSSQSAPPRRNHRDQRLHSGGETPVKRDCPAQRRTVPFFIFGPRPAPPMGAAAKTADTPAPVSYTHLLPLPEHPLRGGCAHLRHSPGRRRQRRPAALSGSAAGHPWGRAG